ncbi:DUF3822 family protein, partial [Arthrospira platensis SPKY1]|nr:DUF3822 family protein [Arthrospira platensis SPKY1]
NIKSVHVLHSNSYFTWVPNPLFTPEKCGSYLQFSSKVFDTDWFTYDVFDKIDATFVYIPLTHLNNILLDFYASFDYYHTSYQWLKKIYATKDNHTLECCILIEKKFIEIA